MWLCDAGWFLNTSASSKFGFFEGMTSDQRGECGIPAWETVTKSIFALLFIRRTLLVAIVVLVATSFGSIGAYGGY